MKQKIKVFVLIDNPYKLGNPYVYTLMDGVSNISNDIEWGYGLSRFWSDEIYEYDIIHVHWPDMILAGNKKNDIVDRLKVRISTLKNKGIKIVVTCHNFKPHYSNDTRIITLYDVFYNNADAFIHLGNTSCDILQNQFPQSEHVVIPHHTYDTLYVRRNRKECLKYLHLNAADKYILCFGAFRDDEERKIVDAVLQHFRNKNVKILAPSYYKIEKRRNLLLVAYQWFRVIWKSVTTSNLYIKGTYVNDEDLPYYYGAASISLLQRKRILNSGNLPMGFLMGNVVVGPDVGNVGELLKKTGNPVFTANDEQSIIKAVEDALRLSEVGKGEDNSLYAKDFFSTSVVSQKLIDFYKSVLLIN